MEGEKEDKWTIEQTAFNGKTESSFVPFLDYS